jgi:hypothetical protein
MTKQQHRLCVAIPAGKRTTPECRGKDGYPGRCPQCFLCLQARRRRKKGDGWRGCWGIRGVRLLDGGDNPFSFSTALV